MKFLLALTICLVGFGGSFAMACDCDKGSECQKQHEAKCKGDKACMDKEMKSCGHHKECKDKEGSCMEHKGDDMAPKGSKEKKK